jgi:tRNA pseudouridine55 synthase
VNGVLVVDKPAGPTSHKVVAEVARRLGGVKAGHAGTLDPMATGVLVVCLGEATKVAGVLVADDKAYDGELELGAETDTLDADGQIVRERRAEAAAVGRAQLAAALARLVGPGQQVPPMYSAVKVDGRRLHAAARAGDEVERAPRPIDVRAFELLSFDPPRARFRVDCSKGTYVRVLVADAGAALGCGAHLTALRRTRSGAMTLERSVPLADVTPERAAAALVPIEQAIGHLPRVPLDADRAWAASVGKPMNWQDISSDPPPAGVVALLAPDGRLLALCEVDPEARVRYRRVFVTP